jgi:FdhD protein
MSILASSEKIDVQSNVRQKVEESIALEAPTNIFINDVYVVTLLSTPTLQQELVIGWLFDEGMLDSFDQIEQITKTQDIIKVQTKQPIEATKLRVEGVSRLFTTACGLSAQKFFQVISGQNLPPVESKYSVKTEHIHRMIKTLDNSELFHSTGGVHVAAIFEHEKLVAFAEDVGRHNSIDKVIGIGIQANIDFSNTILVSSGRQPADMVLKAARMGIPIILSKAAPIRSGIIAAEKTGVTLTCFVREQRMNIYTHPQRIVS